MCNVHIPSNGSIVCLGDIRNLGGVIVKRASLELKINIIVKFERQGKDCFRVYMIPMRRPVLIP